MELRASIRKINGRWYAYFFDRLKTPARKSWPLGTTRKTEALRELSRLTRMWGEGRFDPWNPRPVAVVTVGDAVDDFIQEKKKYCRPATVAAYEDVIYGWLRFSRLMPDVSAESLRPSSFESYLRHQAVTAATRRKRYRHLKVFTRWLVRSGRITDDPLVGLRAPSVAKKVPQYLTVDQVRRLLNTIDAHRASVSGRKPEVNWLKDLILVAVSTGMRLGELCVLTWDSVDLSDGWITVRNVRGFRTKTGNERRIPLTVDARAILERRRVETVYDHVFRSPTGRPLRVQDTSKRFKFFVRKAGLPEYVRFHSLRHTTASWLVMKGVPLVVIQEILGHATISTTELYAHLAPDSIQAAAARMPSVLIAVHPGDQDLP